MVTDSGIAEAGLESIRYDRVCVRREGLKPTRNRIPERPAIHDWGLTA
jgi:hypothetical protein